MKSFVKIFFCIVAGILLFSCTGKELSPVEYVKWIENENNGLRKSKTMDELEFQVQMKPNDYVLLKEENINPLQKKSDFEKEKKQLGDMQYFTLKIKVPDDTDPLKYKIADKNEYFARVKYYSFDIQNDLSLVDGNDTVPCSLMHFERTFGISPEIICLLGFPPSKSKDGVQDKTFMYYDRVFNTGNLVFNFSKKDILQAPKLKS